MAGQRRELSKELRECLNREWDVYRKDWTEWQTWLKKNAPACLKHVPGAGFDFENHADDQAAQPFSQTFDTNPDGPVLEENGNQIPEKLDYAWVIAYAQACFERQENALQSLDDKADAMNKYLHTGTAVVTVTDTVYA